MEFGERASVLFVLCWICLLCLCAAQTEGDTGYDYHNYYDEDAIAGADPEFLTTSVNVTVVEGRDIALQCHISNLGKHKVAWLDQENMPLTFDERRVVDDNRYYVDRPYMAHWNLVIRHVELDNEGVYKCTVNTDPVMSKRVFLQVLVKDQPRVSFPSTRIGQHLGKDVSLECLVTVPTSEETFINWKKDGKKILASSNKYDLKTNEEYGGRLIIFSLQVNNLKLSDFGNYTCTSVNKFGRAEGIVTVYRHSVDVGKHETERSKLKGHAGALGATPSVIISSLYILHLTNSY